MKYCPGGWALNYNEVFLNVAKMKDTVISSFPWTVSFAKEMLWVISLQHKLEHLCLNVIKYSLNNAIMCVFYLLYTYRELLIASSRQRQEEKTRELKWKLLFFFFFFGWSRLNTHEIDSDMFTHKNSIIIAWIGLLISMKTQSNALFSSGNGIRIWFNLN